MQAMKRLLPALFYTLVGLSTLLGGCATPGQLTGGDKDTLAPVVVNAWPTPFFTGFEGTAIRLEFSEYITLKNAANQISLSPPLKAKPKVQAVGEVLTVSWNEDLQPNRTYTLNLGTAVADITEGNVAKNLQLVFSTGSEIDSNFISGQILLAESGLPASGFAVGLFPKDSASPQQRPLYYTTTTEQGTFFLGYLKADSYDLVAYEDKDQNLRFLPGKEPLAFPTRSLEIPGMDSVALAASKEPIPPAYLGNRYRDYGRLDYFFTAPADAQFEVLSPRELPFQTSPANERHDTVQLWFNPEGVEQLVVSMKSRFPDTTRVDTISIRRINPDPLEITLPEGTWHPEETLFVLSSRPLGHYPTADQPAYTTDSLAWHLVPEPSNALKYALVLPYAANRSFEFILLPDAAKDLAGNGLDTLISKVQTRTPDDYAILKCTVESHVSAPHIFEILTEKGGVYKTFTFTGTRFSTRLKNIPPGKYRFRLTLDENGNGKWDPGEFSSKKQPELIEYHPQTLQLRANWEVDETFHFTFEP